MNNRTEKGQFKAKNIKGNRFGKVIALYPTDKLSKDKSIIWVMQCDCGKFFERSASTFRKSISCGCAMYKNNGQFKAKDLTKYILEDAIILCPTHKRSVDKYVIWKLQCKLCNQTFERSASSIIKGTAAHRCKKWYILHPPTAGRPILPNNQAHINQLFSNYSRSAKDRKIEFGLTINQAKELFEGNCHYCDSSPSITYTSSNLAGEYAWNGIDRVNPDKGYLLDNCVSCCSRCNFAKGTMPAIEFKDWIKRVYQHYINM